MAQATGAAMLAAALAVLQPGPGRGAELCTEDAMIVFDGSGSMAEMGFDRGSAPRIFEARQALREAVPGIALNRRLGLVVYGPGPGPVCSNVDVRFGPIWNAAGPIVAAVERLWPAGATPLTEAVRQAAEVLAYRERPGEVLLITDGKETCGGAPCALASELARGGRDLRVHVVGFRVRAEHFSWEGRPGGTYEEAIAGARCLADLTGGEYVIADTVSELVAAMRVTLGCNLFGAVPGRVQPASASSAFRSSGSLDIASVPSPSRGQSSGARSR